MLRRRLAAVLLLAALAAAGAVARASWPGLTSGAVRQLRWVPLEESRNLWHWVSYLLVWFQELSFDPEAGLYSFRLTPEEGRDDLGRGLLAFHRGEFGRAVALIERHVGAEGESEEALFWLAMATYRQAEAESCLAKLRGDHAGHHAGRVCVLPLLEPHERRELARLAARRFERLLDRHGSDDRLYRWLLNLSWMAAGGFPGEVPERYRIDTPFVDAFYGERAARARRLHGDLRFRDRARELGVDSFGAGRGVVAEDFDGDGDLDLAVAGLFSGVRLFRNDGGRFADATPGSGLEAARQPLTLSAADYDGDGRLDLFVVRPFDRYMLFRNRGGTFEEVTAASGLLEAVPEGGVATSWISTWGDVDNDGDLDLFVTNWAFRVPFVSGLPALPRADSTLFVNERGRFRDATAEWGLADLVRDQHLIGAAFGDYDRDGRLDLYLTSPLPATGALLHNEGGRFAPVDLGRVEPGFTAAFVDLDHDGRLDVLHAGFSDGRTAVTRAVFGEHARDWTTGRTTFLMQGRDGRFAARDNLLEGDMPMGTMGASFGDLDNDGCLDLYLGTGTPEPWFILPNLMYRGERDGTRCTGRLADVSALAGFGTLQKGHGIVFFDLDDDGDQDLFSSLGGMWPSDEWPAQLFVNEGEGGAWVKVRLRGRRSNRFGLGATLEVRATAADGGAIVRTYHMDQKTGFGGAPYLAHVGLGDATRVDEVVVRWLGSGCVGSYPATIGALNLLDEAACLDGRSTP